MVGSFEASNQNFGDELDRVGLMSRWRGRGRGSRVWAGRFAVDLDRSGRGGA